jgi:hypothetical protein
MTSIKRSAVICEGERLYAKEEWLYTEGVWVYAEERRFIRNNDKICLQCPRAAQALSTETFTKKMGN